MFKCLRNYSKKLIKPDLNRSDTFVSSTGLASGHGDPENGVCAQVVLVLSPVKLQHQIVDGSLENEEF